MTRGIIRGNSIDLDQGTGLREGQRVSVVVQALPDDESLAGDARDKDRLRGVAIANISHKRSPAFSCASDCRFPSKRIGWRFIRESYGITINGFGSL